jgi:hypothetical protein
MYSQPEWDNKWTKVSHKRGRPTQEEAPRQAKLIKESDHWLNQTPACNHYSALLEDESEDQQQTTDPRNTPKPPPIYVSDVTAIPPLVQLLEQIAKLQYEIKALTGNQVKVQTKTSESYRTITKPLAEKYKNKITEYC